MLKSPARVSLLAQASHRPPVSALVKLGKEVPLDPDAAAAAVSKAGTAFEHSQAQFLHALSLARASRLDELGALLRTIVHDGLRQGRCAERNRALFLAAVLSADEVCADALVRFAAPALCASLRLETHVAVDHERGASSHSAAEDQGQPFPATIHEASTAPLSLTERHWVCVAFAEMAARPSAAEALEQAGLLQCLACILRVEPCDGAKSGNEGCDSVKDGGGSDGAGSSSAGSGSAGNSGNSGISSSSSNSSRRRRRG